MIFISSPYTHPVKEIEELRFQEVAKFCAKMVSQGHNAFSPIVYGHTLLNFHEMPGDWKFWQDFCQHFLKLSDKMIVLKMTGCENSTGVSAEIKFATDNNIPIQYMEMKSTYVLKVLERLHHWRSDDTKFDSIDYQDILTNMDYVNHCEKNELSPYKCLVFFNDHINGDYIINDN